jgi:hypothetical protein
VREDASARAKLAQQRFPDLAVLLRSEPEDDHRGGGDIRAEWVAGVDRDELGQAGLAEVVAGRLDGGNVAIDADTTNRLGGPTLHRAARVNNGDLPAHAALERGVLGQDRVIVDDLDLRRVTPLGHSGGDTGCRHAARRFRQLQTDAEGTMFTVGAWSMTVATSFPCTLTNCWLVTVKGVGIAPWSHRHSAPMHTTFPGMVIPQ